MSDVVVSADITQGDIDQALERFVAGIRIANCCPVQRALQRTTDRAAVVYRFSWHLAAQDRGKARIPATKGVSLPEVAVTFIATFDTWAKAILWACRTNVSLGLDDARAAVKERAPRPFRFDVALPDGSNVTINFWEGAWHVAAYSPNYVGSIDLPARPVAEDAPA